MFVNAVPVFWKSFDLLDTFCKGAEQKFYEINPGRIIDCSRGLAREAGVDFDNLQPLVPEIASTSIIPFKGRLDARE